MTTGALSEENAPAGCRRVVPVVVWLPEVETALIQHDVQGHALHSTLGVEKEPQFAVARLVLIDHGLVPHFHRFSEFSHHVLAEASQPEGFAEDVFAPPGITCTRNSLSGARKRVSWRSG